MKAVIINKGAELVSNALSKHMSELMKVMKDSCLLFVIIVWAARRADSQITWEIACISSPYNPNKYLMYGEPLPVDLYVVCFSIKVKDAHAAVAYNEID